MQPKKKKKRGNENGTVKRNFWNPVRLENKNVVPKVIGEKEEEEEEEDKKEKTQQQLTLGLMNSLPYLLYVANRYRDEWLIYRTKTVTR